MIKIYEKLCELKGCNTLTGRVIEQRIPYSGTRYPEINKKVFFASGSQDLFFGSCSNRFATWLFFMMYRFRSNATLTVPMSFTILRTTRISWGWCSEPMTVTRSFSPANRSPRSLRKPSERRATNYRKDAISTWFTTSDLISRIHTNPVISLVFMNGCLLI